MFRAGDKFKDQGDDNIYKIISVRTNHYRVKSVTGDEFHKHFSYKKSEFHQKVNDGWLLPLFDGLERAIRRLDDL